MKRTMPTKGSINTQLYSKQSTYVASKHMLPQSGEINYPSWRRYILHRKKLRLQADQALVASQLDSPLTTKRVTWIYTPWINDTKLALIPTLHLSPLEARCLISWTRRENAKNILFSQHTQATEALPVPKQVYYVAMSTVVKSYNVSIVQGHTLR